jgi:hypothetical protein
MYVIYDMFFTEKCHTTHICIMCVTMGSADATHMSYTQQTPIKLNKNKYMHMQAQAHEQVVCVCMYQYGIY